MMSKLNQMKYFAVLLLAVLFLVLYSFNAFSQSEVPMGGDDTFSMQASQTIYKPEVRYIEYESTCSREVYDGTVSTCSPGRTERRCRKIAGVGEECWEETEEICSDVETTRTETYSCTKVDRVVEQVYDYDVNANISVVKSLRSKNYDLGQCHFGVKLAANSESFYARCNEAIIKINILERKETIDQRNKKRNIVLELDFFPIAELNALKFGIVDLKFTNNKLTFNSFDLTKSSNYKLTVVLSRNRILLKDKVILTKILTINDLKIISQDKNGLSLIEVDLQKLSGGFDSTKKHNLKVELKTIKNVDVSNSINLPSLTNLHNNSLIINN